ncbi:hypothetical protein Mapa_013472 [Marchantia paleacea]|nr:hypothetical protein Mapa_013472 [Marchantia paleacea]
MKMGRENSAWLEVHHEERNAEPIERWKLHDSCSFGACFPRCCGDAASEASVREEVAI